MRQRLAAIAQDILLPRLVGSRVMDPSPYEVDDPSVLVYRDPVGPVLVGIQLTGVSEREFLAAYVAQALFVPTDYPVFQAVGMERRGIRRLFRDRRWLLDGHQDADVLQTLTTFVVQEGAPILDRRAALRSFADELIGDEHELESDPIATEQAAYAYLLAGMDRRATELLEVLITATGSGWPGETEISVDEMQVLRNRAAQMLAYVMDDRAAALQQLDRWRQARLDNLNLGGAN